MEIDPTQEGLRKALKDWQLTALRYIWNAGGIRRVRVPTIKVFNGVNAELSERDEGKKSISRASIINFLDKMANEGVLHEDEETCKGGIRRLYTPILFEEGFREKMVREVVLSFMRDFPEETVKAITVARAQLIDEGIQGLEVLKEQ